MSKKVKNLIQKEFSAKFNGIDAVAVISPAGIDGAKNNKIRRSFREKGVNVTVVKNTLAKRTTETTKLKGFEQLLDGPSAVIYGKSSISSIARMLVDMKKENEKLELRGIFFDGEAYFGEKGIETVSKLPTREEAISAVVGSILGPGRKLAGALKGPGGKLGGILKTIEEKAAKAAPPAAAPVAAAGDAAAAAPTA